MIGLTLKRTGIVMHGKFKDRSTPVWCVGISVAFQISRMKFL